MENNELKKKLEKLEQQKQELQAELRRLKRKPRGIVGYPIFLLGLLMIALAVFYSHMVSAFIGISLTFWGALFFYIRPTRFIRKEILTTTIVEPLKYTYKLLDELEFKGIPKYISPGTLRSLRSATVYIPKSNLAPTPTDKELINDEAIIEIPPAIKLTPPGLGLSKLLEKELGQA